MTIRKGTCELEPNCTDDPETEVNECLICDVQGGCSVMGGVGSAGGAGLES
jgi:hypothetical protein